MDPVLLRSADHLRMNADEDRTVADRSPDPFRLPQPGWRLLGFASIGLGTGLFSAERSKETVYAGLAKTRGSMELTGCVIASSNTTELTAITFDLTLAAGGDQVNLNPSDTTNRTVISYQDVDNNVADVTYTTTVITGNADSLLEAGELFEINIDMTQTALTAVSVTTNETFTLEVKPPSGSYMVIQRTTPASINKSVINLN